MSRAEILAFLQQQRLAVEASVASSGAPQAAVVGIAVTDGFAIVFDTLASTRKAENLRRDARVAFVIGWDDERTVQWEGLADEPTGAELAVLKELYFAAFPDGRERERWPGLVYVRARPTWLRYSDFRSDPPRIVELAGDAFGG